MSLKRVTAAQVTLEMIVVSGWVINHSSRGIRNTVFFASSVTLASPSTVPHTFVTVHGAVHGATQVRPRCTQVCNWVDGRDLLVNGLESLDEVFGFV